MAATINIDTLVQKHSPIDSSYPYKDLQLIALQMSPFCSFCYTSQAAATIADTINTETLQQKHSPI